MTFRGGDGDESTKDALWDDKDKFYYDAIRYSDHHVESLHVRSLVGLIPLYASLTIEPDLLNRYPSFKKRLNWFLVHQKCQKETLPQWKPEGLVKECYYH